MVENRQYKYLIKPDQEQKKKIVRTFGAVRFLHNRYLDDFNSGKNQRRMGRDIVKDYKNQYSFLNQIDPSALMNTIFQLQDRKTHLKKHKSRKDSHCSYTTSSLFKDRKIYIYDKFVHIPDLGDVIIVYHRPIPKGGIIRKATVIRENDGKYYVSIAVEIEKIKVNKIINPEKSIGLDYSSPHFYVDNFGNKIDMPHFYRQKEKKIAIEDKKLKRCSPGSNNYYKQKNRIAKLYKRSQNQRNDFLHKLSTQLANEYDVICVEDLSMKEMSKKMGLGKSTYDNAYDKFLGMLKYKLDERGKMLLYADRYFPSSKTCHICGCINENLTLNDRVWICPSCGNTLDRDVNAAENIRQICLSRNFAVGYPVSAR